MLLDVTPAHFRLDGTLLRAFACLFPNLFIAHLCHQVEKLQATATLYFDQRNFSNRTILEGLMDGLLVHTQSIPASLDFAQSLPIRRLVDVLGDRLLVCMKVLLLARPLIVLSRSATTSSFFSVALASLFPLTISSLADGSLAFESSATFDRKAGPQLMNLPVRILTRLFFHAQVMHAAFKRCDHAETKTTGQDNTSLCLKHFGFPLAMLGNKKLIRPTNQVILSGFFPECIHMFLSSGLTIFFHPD